MIIGRLVAWALLFAALIVVCRDLIGWYDTGRYSPLALGILWSDLTPHTHDAVQDVVQRHIAGWLWDPAIATLLMPPAWIAFALVGLLLLYLCRSRGPRGGRSRRRRWRR